jgi:hypothetical protein
MTDAELTKMLRSSANRVVNYAADRIEALTAKVAELEACLERQGSGHREDLDEIANVSVERLRRAKAAEAERDRLRGALRGLERASTEVASCGARTGPHWLKLTVANLSAREALKGETP